MEWKQIKYKLFGEPEFVETIQPIKMSNETLIELTGNKYFGNETSVSVNWREVLELDEFCGFYHVHPGGYPTPSVKDDETMNSWSKATGKALLLIIKSGNETGMWTYWKEARTKFG